MFHDGDIMYVIMVYDFNVDRVAKALKISRKYFHWVQNSVFEGEINKAKLRKFKNEMQNMMKEDEDSIIIYKMRSTKYSSREILGLEKGGDKQFL